MNKVFVNVHTSQFYEYNKFFNPNICHVCKSRNKGNLILCDRCKMISYCGEEHKRTHYQQHVYICSCIEMIMKKQQSWHVTRFSTTEWFKSKEEFLQLLTKITLRKLQQYEVQMIMCAKSCFVCHIQTNLFTCEICYSSNYCFDHFRLFNTNHSPHCKNLMLLLNLDLANMRNTIKSFHNYKAHLYLRYNEMICIHDMSSFVAKYLTYEDISEQTDIFSTLNRYIYTDYISEPLTLYDGIRQTKLTPLLNEGVCIHVIVADSMDENSLLTWEFFLHLFHNIKNLTIVLIGPKLRAEAGNIDLCYRCKIFGQHFDFECYSMLYHDYVFSSSYKIPEMIIGFQAEFKDTSTKSIIALQHQSCPLFLTAVSHHEAQQNIKVIQKVLGAAVKPVLITENDYRSLRPYKDFKTDSLFYHNAILVAYKNLIG